MVPTEGRVAKPGRWWDCNIRRKHQFQQLSRQQQMACNAATPSSVSSHWKIQDSRQIKDTQPTWTEKKQRCKTEKQNYPDSVASYDSQETRLAYFTTLL